MSAAHDWQLATVNDSGTDLQLLGWRCTVCRKIEHTRVQPSEARVPPRKTYPCKRRSAMTVRPSRLSGHSPGDLLSGSWVYLADGPVSEARSHTAYMVCSKCLTIRLSPICSSVLKLKARCVVCDWRGRLESKLGSARAVDEIRGIAARLGYTR